MRRTRSKGPSKAEEYEQSVRDDRNSWRDEMPQRCMQCGSANAWPGLQVHEIERRSHAPGRWWHRCNALLVCEKCHAGVFASCDVAYELAVKLVRDPLHFDLDTWLRIGDAELRAPERVTMADIARYLEVR